MHFRVSIEKSSVILIDLSLYVTCSFPLAAFNIPSLFSGFSVLIIMWWWNFPFWFNIVDVVQAVGFT